MNNKLLEMNTFPVPSIDMPTPDGNIINLIKGPNTFHKFWCETVIKTTTTDVYFTFFFIKTSQTC